MTWAPAAALVVLLTLAAVLATSGHAKLRDGRATRDAFDALQVPTFVPRGASARVLPWVELALAALLLVAPSGWLVPVAAVVLGLMLAYTWLIVRALRFDEPVSCSCFGALGRHEIDRTTVARNVLLSLFAALALWFALDGGSTSSALTALDAGEWITLTAAASAVVVAVLVVGGGSPTGATTMPGTHDGDVIDYERQPIPYGVVTLLDGTTATLAELASSQARLVIVLNASCGSCVRTATRADAWADQLEPAVGVVTVYPDASSASAASIEHASYLHSWDPDLNVRRLLVPSAPGAVLLGADGLLAGGPVGGEDEVAHLVEAVIAEIAASEPDPSVG